MNRLFTMVLTCLLFSALLLLNGCARSLVAPSDKQAAALALDLDYYTVSPLGFEIKQSGYYLYFVHLDEQGNIPSMAKWYKGTPQDGSWYLLNATPGYWTVVGIGYLDTGIILDTKVIVPFPEKLVKAAKTRLQPGRVAYLGAYKVVGNDKNASWDSVQKYYLKNFLAAEAKLSGLDMLDNITFDFKKGGGIIPTTYTVIEDKSRRKSAFTKMGAAWADRVIE